MSYSRLCCVCSWKMTSHFHTFWKIDFSQESMKHQNQFSEGFRGITFAVVRFKLFFLSKTDFFQQHSNVGWNLFVSAGNPLGGEKWPLDSRMKSGLNVTHDLLKHHKSTRFWRGFFTSTWRFRVKFSLQSFFVSSITNASFLNLSL